jgi:hypothetical protein
VKRDAVCRIVGRSGALGALGLTIVASTIGAQPSATPALARTGEGAVQLYVPARLTAFEGSLPSNLLVPPAYQSAVRTMWRRSTTFRRQCSRIGHAAGLTVVLRSGPATAGVRARTQIAFGPGGRVYATVEINRVRDEVELIAHEIEHIIEQLDGVDLVSTASRVATGVDQIAHDEFETRRAIRIGVKVAREVAGSVD